MTQWGALPRRESWGVITSYQGPERRFVSADIGEPAEVVHLAKQWGTSQECGRDDPEAVYGRTDRALPRYLCDGGDVCLRSGARVYCCF
jgi:hypothetical protein